MSYQYSKAVYWNVTDTTAPEQSVLAALAFCHNHETGRCDPSIKTLTDMTHLGVSTVNRVLSSLKELKYVSWISGGKGNKGVANSNKYTLHLPLEGIPSQSGIPSLPQREGDPPRAGYPPSHSGTQKRIERESKYNTNPNIKKVLSGLVGDSFDDAAKPRSQQEPSEVKVVPADVEGAVDAAWEEYPQCKFKTPSAKMRFGMLYAQLREQSGDGAAFDAMIIASLKEWRECEQWTKSGGQYIPAPINFLSRRLWEVEFEQPEQEEPELLPNFTMIAGSEWELCEERCAKYGDGCCSVGIKIPPAYDMAHPHPPEECPRFVPLQ